MTMNSKTMKAVGVVPGRREVELIDHPAPVLTDSVQVRFKTLEVGICGTDKEICTFVYGSPPRGFDYLVLGHEALGEVVEIGSEVAGLKPGDLVVPSVRRPCSHPDCVPCRAGLQDFCSSGDFTERGIKMTHGYMTEYVVEDEQYLNFVPAGLRDVAVLVEPLTVAEKALAQIWKVQKRLPWEAPAGTDQTSVHGRTALVLGAGPVGILGAMLLKTNGFTTSVYSRSKAPNPKSELLESIGIPYISSESESVDAMAERVGRIDVVYEAIGVASLSFEVLKKLGLNGVFVFTGIPAPRSPIPVDAHLIMRNLVLQNQVVLGTVNADRDAFANAVRDLGVFKDRWPGALRAIISGRFALSAFQDLLLGGKSGIKNVIALD
jgi:glucose 1-dehydrogenase